MQNKPNVKDAQINVNSYMKSIYEKLDTWLSGKNKPNSNPNKPNFRKAKMNVNSIITKDYRKKDDFTVRINKPNSKPISKKAKMSANAFSRKDYENKTALRPQKNKAKTNPISRADKRTKETGKKAIRNFFTALARGKIDFLYGCDILLGKIYGKSQFNLLWRIIL